jgi:deoxyribonucleoside regulator
MKQVSKSDKRKAKRLSLLADVATMYYVDQMTQSAIAKVIGTTASNVSRMITDSQRLGVVKIQIERPLLQDRDLEQKLVSKFKLTAASVVVAGDADDNNLLSQVSTAGAAMVTEQLFRGCSIGITWGRTLQAIIEKMRDDLDIGGEVIQLAGSVGATQHEYDAVYLAQELAKRTKSRALHLNAPFIVESEVIAQSLMKNTSNAMTRGRASACDIIIVGVGNVDLNLATLFSSGHLSDLEIQDILQRDAVGEICGHPIGADGKIVSPEFSSRVISIRPGQFSTIPIRIAVGARQKTSRPLLAALRAGYITHLVVDSITANFLIEQEFNYKN